MAKGVRMQMVALMPGKVGWVRLRTSRRTHLIAGDVNLDPFVRVMSSWSLHCKVTKINRYFVVGTTQF